MGVEVQVAIASVPASIAEQEEFKSALAVSPLISRVDSSILWVVTKIFAASLDKRVKRGGYLFLAHLLRLNVSIDQLSLFPGTEVGDVARICLPNILKLCKNRLLNGWPWCYDTTLKYLNLLVAAGVLITRPDEPGIYYLPLGTYALLPDYAARQVEKLSKKRSKVSRSSAFTRTAVHCALPGVGTCPEDVWVVDSPTPDAFVVDEQELQRMVNVLCSTIQSKQGVVLVPATMVEITRVLAKHAPHILKKGEGRFIARPNEKAVKLLQTSLGNGDTSDAKKVGDSPQDGTITVDKRVQRSAPGGRTNLPPDGKRKRSADPESTTLAKNLPVSSQIVDSPRSVLTDKVSNIRKNLIFFSENTLSEGADEHAQESTCVVDTGQAVDSSHADQEMGSLVVPPHPLAKPFSLSTLLCWRFPWQARQLDPQQWELEGCVRNYLAALLSDHFEHNDSRVPHYVKRLKQDARSLDIAIVDGLVRSCFPDPRHKPEQLGGPWVTKMFKAYCGGGPIPPEILAWANTSYSYDAMQAVLAETASWQETQGQPKKRPMPEDIIVDSEQLDNFWVGDPVQDLKRAGWFGVDVDGELLTCEEYEQRRLCLLECILATEALLLSPAVEHEVSMYLNWAMPWVCDTEEEARLLANLPSRLRRNLQELERVLDAHSWEIAVRIAPLSHHSVVEVHSRHDPGQVWWLRNGSDIEEFDRWYRRSYSGEKEVAERVSPSEESTSSLVIKKPDRQEAGNARMERQADFLVGLYRVYFDMAGATIERESTKVCYRLDKPTATNVVDFVRYHRDVVKSMVNDTPDELEAYRVERQAGDELNSSKE